MTVTRCSECGVLYDADLQACPNCAPPPVVSPPPVQHSNAERLDYIAARLKEQSTLLYGIATAANWLVTLGVAFLLLQIIGCVILATRVL